MIRIESNPVEKFKRWYENAAQAIDMPEAMTLTTATATGVPSARMVLLRGCDERGFTFYTNYSSDKARELDANPNAALVFFWRELKRQVRVTGTAARVSRAESEAYWKSRPENSRIAAWASRQSSVLSDRTALEERFARLRDQFRDGDVPLPDFWGGYRVAPGSIEFWKNGDDRLHDRLRYRRNATDEWVAERLFP
jgi:pyridoxamine 5'-phosphate oxidase